MDSRKLEQQIEQLTIQLSGVEGLLNEIVTLLDLFLPTLRQLPQTDKRMLAELEKRQQIAQMMISMKQQSAPKIVDKMW